MLFTQSKTRFLLITAPLALAIAGTAIAQTQPARSTRAQTTAPANTTAATRPAAPATVPGAKDTSRIVSGTYNVDPAHTLVGWEVSHFGFNPYFGQFGNATGTLVLDRNNPSAARVDITIPIDSLSVVSSGLRTHMLTPDFFDQANHATARFVSNRVVIDEDGDEATIHGTLTIKGVSKPVTLDVDFTGAGTHPMNHKLNIGFEAETTIRRSDFGINYGIPIVSDEVKLDITVAFEAA